MTDVLQRLKALDANPARRADTPGAGAAEREGSATGAAAERRPEPRRRPSPSQSPRCPPAGRAGRARPAGRPAAGSPAAPGCARQRAEQRRLAAAVDADDAQPRRELAERAPEQRGQHRRLQDEHARVSNDGSVSGQVTVGEEGAGRDQRSPRGWRRTSRRAGRARAAPQDAVSKAGGRQGTGSGYRGRSPARGYLLHRPKQSGYGQETAPA